MERDDVIEYSLYNHHDEAQGRKVRKMIWTTTIILTIITAIEIFVGVNFARGAMEHSSPGTWTVIKIGYVMLTLVKAGYIVLKFMHLGDEVKWLKWTIIGPYALFIIYLLFICLTEGESIQW